MYMGKMGLPDLPDDPKKISVVLSTYSILCESTMLIPSG